MINHIPPLEMLLIINLTVAQFNFAKYRVSLIKFLMFGLVNKVQQEFAFIVNVIFESKTGNIDLIAFFGFTGFKCHRINLIFCFVRSVRAI